MIYTKFLLYDLNVFVAVQNVIKTIPYYITDVRKLAPFSKAIQDKLHRTLSARSVSSLFHRAHLVTIHSTSWV